MGILATDVKDELFLAEQIRRWSPNVIVFVFDSNLLFVHPQYNTTMFGALSISSFPLAPEGSRRPPPPWDQYRRQFASALQEGTFLAVGSLLGRSIPAPTVWIAACGNYAFSPLAKLPVKPPPEPSPWDPPGEPLGPRGSHDFRAQAATAIAVPAEAVAPADRLGLQLLVLTAVLIVASYRLQRAAFLGRGSRTTPTPGSRLKRSFSQLLAFLWPAAHATTEAQRRIRWHLYGGIAMLSLAAWGLLILAYNSGPLPTDASASLAWLTLLTISLAWVYLVWVFVLTTRLFADAISVVGALGIVVPPALALGTFQLWTPDANGLFYCRASAFSSGLSPLVSLGWLLAALFLWVFVEVKRQLVRERHESPWPLAEGKDEADQIKRLLHRTLLPKWWCLAAFAVIFLPALFILGRLQPIGERFAYGLIFLVLWALASLLGLVSFFRFLAIWRLLLRMLRTVAQDQGYLEALRDAGRIVGWNPMEFSWYAPSFAALKPSVERLQRLIDSGLVPPAACRPGPDQLLDRIRKGCNQGRFYREVSGRMKLNKLFGRTDKVLATERRGWRVTEPYAAARLITYLRHVFVQMRYATIGALSTGLAAIIAVATYAFEPKKLLLLIIWAILIGASGAIIMAFVQMERDAVLSAIGGTAANKIGGTAASKIGDYWPFVSKVLTYVVLPTLALIASQFPFIGSLIGSFLDPLARVLGTG